MKSIPLIILGLLIIFSALLITQAAAAQEKVVIYFFYGYSCPHCAVEEPFLKSLEEKYPGLEVKYLEVYKDENNQRLFLDMAEAYKVTANAVPATFIGNEQPIYGFDSAEGMGKKIEEMIVKCFENGCIDPITKVPGYSNNQTLPETNQTSNQTNQTQGNNTQTNSTQSIIELPFLGTVDISSSSLSLPVFTLIIAGLDGFNPCAFFVLFFLLGFLLNVHSRKRMILVGGIFVFFSAFIYFLFMAAWLNLFLFIGEIMLITSIAGIVAIVFGLINIKDFFLFKEGVSLTISDENFVKLKTRMRILMRQKSLHAMIAGTILLSIAANTYELLCTAGFPMIYTRALTLSNVDTMTYYIYLIFYNIIYVIPLMTILIIFLTTMGSKKMTRFHARVLKMLSGVMMTLFGLVMLLKPELMSNILVAIGILGIAVVAALVSYLFFRKKQKPESVISIPGSSAEAAQKDDSKVEEGEQTTEKS